MSSLQACSTWRAVSRSDRLWQRLTSLIWGRENLRVGNTWREEYIYHHGTASNFRRARYVHAHLEFEASDEPVGLICRCLALSHTHLAAGFADGAVRLFLLRTRRHFRTFRPRHRNHVGPFSRTVAGIILSDSDDTADGDDGRLIFASRDGDVYVAALRGRAQPRRAVVGDAFTDGALVDFAGFRRWWVGLFAGVPGRAFHVWDGASGEPVYVGGALTDPEALMGWHQLAELTELVGRVRVASQDSAVACTGGRVIVFDIANGGGELVVREEEEYLGGGGLIVASVDASNSAYVVVDRGGEARVRRVDTFAEVCRFGVAPPPQQEDDGGLMMMGCMNKGYALMCAGGGVRVWEVERDGQYLYSFRERVGEPTAMVADDRYVAAYFSDASLHLWDFGPHQH